MRDIYWYVAARNLAHMAHFVGVVCRQSRINMHWMRAAWCQLTGMNRPGLMRQCFLGHTSGALVPLHSSTLHIVSKCTKQGSYCAGLRSSANACPRCAFVLGTTFPAVACFQFVDVLLVFSRNYISSSWRTSPRRPCVSARPVRESRESRLQY